MAAPRGRRGGSVSEDNCVKCKKKSGGCWFQYDACDSRTHAECMSMTADEYQTLKKFPNFRYYCDYCFPETTVNATLQCAEIKNNLSSLEKKVEKALQFVEKKAIESDVKTPDNVRKQHSQDCSTGIRIQNVPEIASQNSAQRFHHDMEHVMTISKHLIGEEPFISDCFRIGKYEETTRRGIIVKLSNIWTTRKLLANSHHMKDSPADYRALISRELKHKERIIERNLLRKRRELIGNGTKHTSIRIRNLKLYVDGKEQPANLWQPTYCNLMLINARSVKKPNAVFHLSTDLAAQPIDWYLVTESWLNSDIDDIFISIPNYTLLRCDRSAKNSKKNQVGGVCSYVRSNFLCIQIYPQDNEQFEVLWLEIDIMSLCALIGVVYYPPLCDYDEDLRAYLIQAYEHLCLAKNYWQFIMFGDFNDFCTDNVIAECKLTQINFESTHNNKVLEKVWVSCPLNISTVHTVIPTVSTDQDSVLCSLQITKNGKKVFYFRDQRESCRQMCCYKLLRDANYNCVYRPMDPNEALCQLNFIMYSAFHISCLTRQVVVRDRNPIYVTPAVKLLIKQRNKQLRKQNAAKVKDLNERIRKLVQKNCRILDKVGSRNWWTHINSLSKDKQPASPVNVDVNNFNWYFNSFSKDPNGQPQLEKIEYPTGELPCFYPLEVNLCLKKQKQTPHESSGLPFLIFTYAAETLAEPIYSLFNLILLSRTFLDFFKISNIRPIPKVARPTLPNHFRPIAVTPILSRLFERMLYDKHIKKPYKTYICSKQFGFRQNSSTYSALIDLLHDVYSLRKNYNWIRLFTLDMSKAFDTFQHSEIFKEISRCVPRLNEYVVDVLKCFLTVITHHWVPDFRRRLQLILVLPRGQ